MSKNLTVLTLSLLIANLSLAESKVSCSNIDRSMYDDEYRTCLRLQLSSQASDLGVDCAECFAHEQETQKTADWVQALAAVAQPLAYLGSAYVTARYQYKTQQAWADAYKDAASQCTNRFNSYLNYTTEMGANAVTSDEATTLSNSCNGSSYNMYSGFGGYIGNSYGGYSNPWLSNGYSSGFMTGMVGPYYGGYSSGTYGMGMGTGLYGGLSTGLYGYGGYGSMYGSIGMGTGIYGLSYGSSYPGLYGSSMYYGGMGMNSMYSGNGYSFGSTPYSAGNLSTSVGLSSTSYSF